MKILTLTFIMLASLASGQTAYRFINPQYGVKDTREWMPESLYTNCVLWMPMNNDPTKLSSWGVPDGSWSRNNGTQAAGGNRPVWTNAANGALVFDGTDDAVSCGDTTSLDGLTSISFSAWIYVNANIANQSFVSKFLTTGNQRCAWFRVSFDTVSSYNYGLSVYTEGSFANVSSSYIFETITTGAWKYVVYTWTATDTFTAYVNGESKSLVSISAGTRPSSITNTSASLKIGNSDSASTALSGKINNVMIFNRAITSNEVAYLYNQTKGAYGL